MSSRKSRLSLSKDLNKDKNVKTPNTRRTSARTPKGRKSPDSQRNDESYEVSPSQSSDYSPMVPFTQDNSFHAINGVSWEWNSPQRLRDQQPLKITAANNYYKPPLRPKYSDVPDTAPTKKPTGFNKFISKLNLLMEKENVAEQLNTAVSEPSQQSELPNEQLNTAISEPIQYSELPDESCNIDEFFVENDIKQSVEATKSEDSDDDIFQEHVIDTPVKHSAPTGTELDDSKLDFLLIEASQTMEQNLNKPPSSPPRPLTPELLQPQQESAPSAKEIASHLTIPIEMNDSDMDGFLVQASLMAEEKLSDSSQESSSNSNVQQTVNHPIAVTTNFASLPVPIQPNDKADKKDTKRLTSASEGTSEPAMSQAELKALIEKKRQEALRRLQNNRLKRGIKGTNSHG